MKQQNSISDKDYPAAMLGFLFCVDEVNNQVSTVFGLVWFHWFGLCLVRLRLFMTATSLLLANQEKIMAKKIVPAQNNNNTQEKAAAFLNVKIMCADGKARTIGKFGLGLFASSKLDAFLIQELSADPDKIESLQEKLVISFHEVADESADIADLVQL